MRRLSLHATAHPARTRLFLLALFGLLISVLFSQAPPGDRLARFRQMSRDAEAKGLAEPFKGITTNGTVEAGLFSIRSTGVTTAPVRKAAENLLAVLTKEQRDKTMFPVDDPEYPLDAIRH